MDVLVRLHVLADSDGIFSIQPHEVAEAIRLALTDESDAEKLANVGSLTVMVGYEAVRCGCRFQE